jgi:hypothetical protein
MPEVEPVTTADFPWSIGLPVDFAAIADADDNDRHDAVFDVGDQPEIADTVAPKACELPGQTVSNTSRVATYDPLLEEIEDSVAILL